MNIKKRLNHEAKLTHQKILEEDDKNFLLSLQERISEPKRKPLLYHWKAWITGAACTVTAAIIIVCTVLFIPRNQRVVYFEENLQTSTSDIVTLNTDLKDFRLLLGEDLKASEIKRTVDAPSGDLLYYDMTLQTIDSRIHTYVKIICNQNYTYTAPLPSNLFRHAELSDYSVLYNIDVTKDSTLQFSYLTAYAKIEGKNDIIYITDYREVALDENGTLLEFIQDLIQVKE